MESFYIKPYNFCFSTNWLIFLLNIHALEDVEASSHVVTLSTSIIIQTGERGAFLKKYSFRLQTVLEMREKKLEDKRREMAEVIAKLNEQTKRLEGLIARETNVRSTLEHIYSSGEELDILEITNYKDFLGKVIVDAKSQEKIIEKTKYLLRFKQLEVTEALRAVKILEKLKETQEKKFYQHYEYVQAKELDDIASTRYKKAMI